jgi:FtsH-binding integral membrane protein
VALLLLAGWVVVIQATRRSLGFGGAILIAGIFGALVWLLIAKGGVFQPHGATTFSHLGLVALSLLLAIGMGWAIVRRKLTGQVEVDTERD